MAGEASTWFNLARSFCGVAGWRDGTAADLCDGYFACRTAWSRSAAGDAFRGSSGGIADDAGETDQAACRCDDAGMCRNLWRGNGGLRIVKEHLAECGRAGDCGSKRYGKRGGSLKPSAIS